MNFNSGFNDDSNDGRKEFESAGISNLEELYCDGDVEGPLHLSEKCGALLNYEVDFALSKENSIQILPASVVSTGFTRQDEDYDLKVQKAHIVKEVREVKLKNIKSFGVTFSEPGPVVSSVQNARSSPVLSTRPGSECGSGKKQTGAFTSATNTSSSNNSSSNSAGTACAYPACEGMSNLQFYSFGSNLVVVDRMIKLAGNCDVGCAFQMEGVRSVWDLSTDPTLLSLLHDRGLTEALLVVICTYSCADNSTSSSCAESDSYHRDLLCALATVTLANMCACDAVIQAVAQSGLSVLEALSALCGKYIDYRAQSRAAVDNRLGSAVNAALAAPELARHSRRFLECLTQQLQAQQCAAAAAAAACPVSARVLPSLYKFGGAGGSIVRVTTHG